MAGAFGLQFVLEWQPAIPHSQQHTRQQRHWNPVPMKRASANGKSSPTPRSEPLAGSHLAQLQAALLDSFSLDELAKMLRLELGCDLATRRGGAGAHARCHHVRPGACGRCASRSSGCRGCWRRHARPIPTIRRSRNCRLAWAGADLCAAGVPLSRHAALYRGENGACSTGAAPRCSRRSMRCAGIPSWPSSALRAAASRR